MNARAINGAVDAVYDNLLAHLGCEGSGDAFMVSHWQDDPCGFRISISRRSDNRTATRFVDGNGNIIPPLRRSFPSTEGTAR